MCLFLGTTLLYSFCAGVELLQNRSVLLLLRQRLDKAQRKADIRDRRNRTARRSERIAQRVLVIGQDDELLSRPCHKALGSADGMPSGIRRQKHQSCSRRSGLCADLLLTEDDISALSADGKQS